MTYENMTFGELWRWAEDNTPVDENGLFDTEDELHGVHIGDTPENWWHDLEENFGVCISDALNLEEDQWPDGMAEATIENMFVA